MSENPQKILEIFYQIAEIPHPSGQTKDLREFLIDFLRACACEVKTDSAGNIYALKGAPKVVFQAHYDMVLVGEKVEPFIENGFLKSRNSSLGADNGIAVATLLHLAKTQKNIEILLTNDEEIGMLGAKNLALKTHAKAMINLDSECINEICVGCAGGFDVDIDLGNLSFGNSPLGLHSADFTNLGHSADLYSVSHPKFAKNHESQTENPSVVDSADSQNLWGEFKSKKPFKSFCYFWLSPKVESPLLLNSNQPNKVDSQNLRGKLPIENKDSAESSLDSAILFYEFSARDFKGGHSGIDIDKNIKNAIVELLFALDSVASEFEILEISGGEARNSIPINAHAIIATRAPINPHTAESAPHIAIKKLASYATKQKALKSAVVAHLLRLHNGIYEVQGGSVTSSLNFSQISQKELKIMVRGNRAEFLEHHATRLQSLFGDAVKISGFYSAWERAENIAESTLFQAISRIYQNHKITFKVVQIHAGLECGILKEKCGLDEVVSIGPTILHPHSKNEMIDLKSFERFCAIVGDLCEI